MRNAIVMPTGVLFGPISLVVGTALCGIWGATQWTAAALGYQARLGAPWIELLGIPVYHPWKLFEWWFVYEAYAPDVFLKGGVAAGASGLIAAGVAVATAVLRSRLRVYP